MHLFQPFTIHTLNFRKMLTIAAKNINKFIRRVYFKMNTANFQKCHEIFELYFFSLIEPNWVPDKQAKMVFLKNLFSQRSSNLKFEKFDSMQANTAWS